MIIAAFRSRMQTMKFFEALKGRSVSCSIINTPREASIGCGISVKFNECDFCAAKAVLSPSYNTFSGFFRTKVKNGASVTERV